MWNTKKKRRKATMHNKKIIPFDSMPEHVKRIGTTSGKCLSACNGLNISEITHVIANMAIAVGESFHKAIGIRQMAQLDQDISQMIFLARTTGLSDEELAEYQSARSELTGRELTESTAYDVPPSEKNRN